MGSVTTPSVRTFHARRGRLGPELNSALDDLLPLYGVPLDDAIDPAALFDPALPVMLEVGSGMGEATLAMATAEPGVGIVAVDVHTRGVASLLRAIHARDLTNVRVAHGDALLLATALPTDSLAGVRAWFPDPWPKARHHKRRLVQPPAIALLASRIRPGGTLHLATDWAEYAEQMLEVLSAESGLVDVRVVPRPEWRPVTRYERAALQAGRPVTDLLAVRG